MSNVLIVPCAGEGSRWNNYLGVPKQLVEIVGSLRDRCQLARGHQGPCSFIPDDGSLVAVLQKEKHHGNR